MPTPEALTRSVPHFSLQALNHLITEITPNLPPPPRRGPKGMAITTRVRLALAHLREGISLRGLARILGIPATTLRDNVNPVLAAFDQLAPLLPDGTVITDFDDIAWWCAEHAGTIIVDGTEFGVARPAGQAEQRPFYSGKKKLHTHKTIAVCDKTSDLLWVTPLVGGATHDLTALRDANLPVHLADSGLDVLADSGFQGLQHDVTAVELPTRRRRCDGELTKIERFFNPVLASSRVRVEHAIGRFVGAMALPHRSEATPRPPRALAPGLLGPHIDPTSLAPMTKLRAGLLIMTALQADRTLAGVTPASRVGDISTRAQVRQRVLTPDREVSILGLGLLAAVLLFGALVMDRLTYDYAIGALVFVVIVVVSMPILRRIADQDGEGRLFGILLAALIAKLTFSLVRYFVIFRVYGGIGDAGTYDRDGWALAQAIRSGSALPDIASVADEAGTGRIVQLTGYIYVVIGRSLFGGFFIYSWLAFWGCILFWRGLLRAFPEADHRRYMLLVLFWPSLLFWPSSIGKDAVMVFLLGLAAYGACLLLAPRPLVWGAPVLALGIGGMMLVRTHVALMAVLAVTVATAFAFIGGTRVENARGRGRAARIVALVGLVMLAIAATTQTTRFFSETAGQATSTSEALELTKERTSQGGSAFESTVVSSPAQVPAATVNVLFRPFPWEARNAGSLFSAGEAGLIVALFVASWKRLRRWPGSAWRRPVLIYAAAYCLMFVVAFSSIGNAGILARQRSQMLPLLFVAFAVPASRWWRDSDATDGDVELGDHDRTPADGPMDDVPSTTDSLGLMSGVKPT